jgi:flagellar protein FliO/FliZ
MTTNATPVTQTKALTVARSDSPGFTPGPVWGGLALAALAAVAWVLTRRRAVTARRLELVESMSLGPRRSLGLVRVEGRLLVVGVSEAGVQLLTTFEPSAPPAEAVPSDVSRAPEALAFENLLIESTAEQELRARLAAARLGGVTP